MSLMSVLSTIYSSDLVIWPEKKSVNKQNQMTKNKQTKKQTNDNCRHSNEQTNNPKT